MPLTAAVAGAGLWTAPEHVGTAVFRRRKGHVQARVWTDRNPCAAAGKATRGSRCGSRVGLPRSKWEPPRGPEAPLLGVHPEDLDAGAERAVPPPPHVHGSIAHRSQAVEAAQGSIGGWTDVQNGGPPRDGLLSSLRKEGAWTELEDFVLSEMGQSPKDRSCRTPRTHSTCGS